MRRLPAATQSNVKFGLTRWAGTAAATRRTVATARRASRKEAFLLGVLDLPNGVPRKDVFRRGLSLLDPSAFQTCFAAWLKGLRDQAAAATEIDQPVYAVDGKTARRSHDRRNGLGALHSVSVWASDFGLSLGQVACADKSNEITAIPQLLRLVDISRQVCDVWSWQALEPAIKAINGLDLYPVFVRVGQVA